LAGIGLVCILLSAPARRLAHAEDCPTLNCNFQRTGLVEDSGLYPPLVLKWSVDTTPLGAPDPLMYVRPVVYDGVVYIAHRDDSWVMAFDALSGSVKWSKRVSGNCTLGGEIYQPTVTADGIFLVWSSKGSG
jgi:outer membrane protein assembly factor BamB